MRTAIDGVQSLEEFSRAYMDLFRTESTSFDEHIYKILNDVYLDADEYVPSANPDFAQLKDQHPNFIIDDEEFIRRIRVAFKSLE